MTEPTEPALRDCEGDVWIERPSGLWRIKRNVDNGDPDLGLDGKPKGMMLADLAAEYGPLTDATGEVTR